MVEPEGESEESCTCLHFKESSRRHVRNAAFTNVIIKNSEGDIGTVEASLISGSFTIDGLPLESYQIEVNYFGLETRVRCAIPIFTQNAY